MKGTSSMLLMVFLAGTLAWPRALAVPDRSSQIFQGQPDNSTEISNFAFGQNTISAGGVHACALF